MSAPKNIIEEKIMFPKNLFFAVVLIVSLFFISPSSFASSISTDISTCQRDADCVITAGPCGTQLAVNKDKLDTANEWTKGISKIAHCKNEPHKSFSKVICVLNICGLSK